MVKRRRVIMRRAVGILATAVAPMFVAAVTLAAEPTGTGTAPGSGAQHYGSGTGPLGSETGAGSTAGTRSGSMMNEHQMSGTITELDKEEGEITFKGADGKELELQLPRTAVQNLSVGERVTLQIAIRPASRATSGAGAGAGTGTGTGGSRGSGAGPGGAGTGSGSMGTGGGTAR
jgi:hypothetical protein